MLPRPPEDVGQIAAGGSLGGASASSSSSAYPPLQPRGAARAVLRAREEGSAEWLWSVTASFFGASGRNRRACRLPSRCDPPSIGRHPTPPARHKSLRAESASPKRAHGGGSSVGTMSGR